MSRRDHEKHSTLSPTYCISHFQGDPTALLACIDDHPYTLYNKSGRSLGPELDRKAVVIENNGYNLSSYLQFIIKNYSTLPARIAFIKSDIFPRHVSEAFFKDTIQTEADFIAIADYSTWQGIRWPASYAGNDNMLYEINNSWYRFKHQRCYFATYNDFFRFFFRGDEASIPLYLRFAPGGNYLVSSERILRHPRTFYQNLLDVISGSPLACEAHYLERSLPIIWDSGLQSYRRERLNPAVLEHLAAQCKRKMVSDRRWRHQLHSLRLRLACAIGHGINLG